MPEICRFFGIIVTMYFLEHGIPHFHVRYNEYKAAFAIDPFHLLEGKLPPRIYGFVMEWTIQHQDELLTNWQILKDRGILQSIKPLE